MVDLDRDDHMVEAVEITMIYFNDVEMAAGTSLMGEHFLEWPCLLAHQVTQYLVGSKIINVTEMY